MDSRIVVLPAPLRPPTTTRGLFRDGGVRTMTLRPAKVPTLWSTSSLRITVTAPPLLGRSHPPRREDRARRLRPPEHAPTPSYAAAPAAWRPQRRRRNRGAS